MTTMTKPVILTGIRANNNLTLGNYFGAILPMIDMAKHHSDEYQVNLFIPDLHSFTTPIDHSQLHQQILDTARFFTAAGLPLDNDNIHMYRQSYVPAHSELTIILNSFTGMGEMGRMTQFKDKAGTIERDAIKGLKGTAIQVLETDSKPGDATIRTAQEHVSVGLFDYPVLMAADILLYGATYVPVGDDQTQHLEFTRDIAERMNARFGELFVVPKPVKEQHAFFGKDQGLRIMDLQNPSKKMSKSDDSGKGVIFLTDDPDQAVKKIMSATTDDKATVNYDRVNQPGISNLLQILSLLRNQSLEVVVAEFASQTSYGEFKSVVAAEVKQFLQNFQSALATVNDDAIFAKLSSSEQAMNEQANQILAQVQKAIGLRA